MPGAASTRSVSPPEVVPAWRLQNGSSTAARHTTSGRPTSGASGGHTERRAGSGPDARGVRQALTMAWPFEEHDSGRPCRRSPLYDRLLQQGGVLGEKLGWERPNWFADVGAGEEPATRYSYGRQNWFAAVGREHAAMRERAGLIDQTSFAKFALKGPGSLAALQWLCANDVDKPVGAVTYTQMLDARGGIQCDVTVARTGHNEFRIVTGTGFATPRLRLDRTQPSCWRRRPTVRRHVGDRRAGADGTGSRATSSARSRTTKCRTRRSRSAPCGR